MSAPDFRAAIDWSKPWLAPLRAGASLLLSSPDWRQAASTAAAGMDLRNHCGLPVRFVPQESLPAGTAYEAFISSTGHVPSRDNLHDFFNALIWLHFPHTKVRLNALQAAEIGRAGGISAVRGKVRDAATIFDENAAIFIHRDPAMAVALRAHDWKEVFGKHRDDFGVNWEVWLFGHALIEKLVNPYKAITAHASTIIADPAFFRCGHDEKRGWIDQAVSNLLTPVFSSAALAPLPVAGVPGWWPGQDATFYDDASVFRPMRKPRTR
jgi:hypothetical protein